MKKGDKKRFINDIEISPADYVIDLLRCTIEVEDPYIAVVIFYVLFEKKIAPCLQICRVKNKFVSEIEDHKRTNILMNLTLKYPHNYDEFSKSSMRGEFNEKMCGKYLLVFELQITMKDFLLIKVRHFVFLFCL